MTAVSVTARHIATGIREDCEGCPVALAVIDALPDIPYVIVSPEAITVGPIDAETRITPPAKVQDFIWAFDGGGLVEPFTFELDYPAVTP